MEVVVVSSLGVGSHLCGALRQARIPARLSEDAADLDAPAGGVVLLDIGATGQGASQVVEVLARAPGLRVVVLGPDEPGDDLTEALVAGAAGYLPRTTDPDALARAVRGVLDGDVALPRAWVGRLVAALRVARDPLRGPPAS